MGTPNLSASTEQASFGWFSPLELDDMEIVGKEEHSRVDLKSVTADRSWPRLLGTAPDLGTISAPVLFIKGASLAKPISEHYVQEFVESMADRIIAKLNEKTPVEDSVNRLFPKTKDWVFHMSADADFIQAAFGPPSALVPVLPDDENRMEDVRIEVWLRSTTEGAKALEGLSQQPLAKQLVQRYLEATLPRLAESAKERSVTAKGGVDCHPHWRSARKLTTDEECLRRVSPRDLAELDSVSATRYRLSPSG